MSFGWTFGVVSALWLLSELGLRQFKRSGEHAQKRDAGTFQVVNLTIYASLLVGIGVGASSDLGRVSLPVEVRWAGIALIVAGLLLRWYAILTLRRFFTVDVAIHPEHKVIDSGPYRFVRHPSYSGALVSFVGLGVAFSNWLSALLVLVPITASLVYRIRVEEQALREGLGAAYEQFCRTRKRLVPWIY